MQALKGALSLTKGKYSKPYVFHLATSKFSWQEKKIPTTQDKTPSFMVAKSQQLREGKYCTHK